MLPALSAFQWIVAGISSLMVGLMKTGLPALSTLVVPLFALVLPARQSTGALLPLLILGDAIAVVVYRRSADWRALLRLLPWAAGGIVAGWLLMGRIDDRLMRPVLGAVVLVMLAVNLWRTASTRGAPVPTQWWFAAVMGILAGATTMVANAAGPVMMIYLLAMRLSKEKFIGTGAWFFFFINWIKVPFSAGLGLITPSSLLLGAVLAGGVVAGAAAGILVAKRIPEKAFDIAMQALTAVAAVTLFF